MKQGRTLVELATEVQRQMESKRDFVADTRQLFMNSAGMIAMGDEHEPMDLTNHAHSQVADRLKIPMNYYRRMMDENPNLLADNVNAWFLDKPEKRMLRTIDGQVRAFVSDKFRCLDNYDFLEAILEPIQMGGLTIESMQVTDTKLYVKAIIPSMTRELVRGETKKNDIIQGAIVFKNSEVGCGALSAVAAVKVVACSNLAMFNDVGIKRLHLGKKHETDGVRELLTQETKNQGDRAMWMEMRDVATSLATDRTHFDKNVDQMIEAVDHEMEISPVKVVENIRKKMGFDKGHEDGILEHLIKGGDLNQYGLHNAVTRLSQDMDGYESASELERVGGKIIELPKSAWMEVAA